MYRFNFYYSAWLIGKWWFSSTDS